MNNSHQNTFQLSVLSQNDPGAKYSSELFCTVTKVTGGSLKPGSEPLNKPISLPIPSSTPPPTPTWFLDLCNDEESSYSVKITCPTEKTYPTCYIEVKSSDVEKWGAVPYDQRDNQIYSKGEYGVFGFAQIGKNGLIYTITAGVLNPKKQAY